MSTVLFAGIAARKPIRAEDRRRGDPGLPPRAKAPLSDHRHANQDDDTGRRGKKQSPVRIDCDCRQADGHRHDRSCRGNPRRSVGRTAPPMSSRRRVTPLHMTGRDRARRPSTSAGVEAVRPKSVKREKSRSRPIRTAAINAAADIRTKRIVSARRRSSATAVAMIAMASAREYRQRLKKRRAGIQGDGASKRLAQGGRRARPDRMGEPAWNRRKLGQYPDARNECDRDNRFPQHCQPAELARRQGQDDQCDGHRSNRQKNSG